MMHTEPIVLPSGERVVLRVPTLVDLEAVGLDDAAGMVRRLVVSVDDAPPPDEWEPTRRDTLVLDHLIAVNLLGTDPLIADLARSAVEDSGREIRIPIASSVEFKTGADGDRTFHGFGEWITARHPTAGESNDAHRKAAGKHGADRSLFAGEIALLRICITASEKRANMGDAHTVKRLRYADLAAWPWGVADTLLIFEAFRTATTASEADVARSGEGWALTER